MDSFFYVVAIMGCGDGGERCAAARMLPARYATAAQCRAALPGALAGNTDVPYPTIAADCRPQGVKMASAKAKPRG